MKRYVVAIDARWAVRTMGGIGQYVLQLARRIPALAPDLRLTLLVDRAMENDLLPDGCEQVVLGHYLGDGVPAARLYSPFWMNFEVPNYLARNGVALFHAANFVLPRFVPCPTTVTVHDLSFFRAPSVYGPVYRRYMRLQIRSAVRRAAALVAISNRTRDDMVEWLHVPGETIQVIHCGVDSSFTEHHTDDYLCNVRSQLALPGSYILHVGGVEEKKNPGGVVRASSKLLQKGLVDAVLFAGRDGLGAGRVRRLASKLGLGSKVRFLGFVPQELLPGLYALATLFVFPSHFEGFGLPVLEAMASGVPVIASGTTSIPEVAGDAAILVDPTDWQGLGQTIESALTDTDLRSKLRARGLVRVRQFSWDKAAEHHVAVYRRVLGIG